MRSGLLRRCASYWTCPTRSINTALISFEDAVRIAVICWAALAACGAGASLVVGPGSEGGTAAGTGAEAMTCDGDDGFCCERILHHRTAPSARASAVQSRTMRNPG